MSKESEILNALLERYEKSSAFKGEETKRRIMIKNPSFYNSDREKSEFFHALDSLKAKDLIDYSWKRGERGNLVEEVWLIVENVEESYGVSRRARKDLFLLDLEKSIREESEKIEDEEIKAFLLFLAEKCKTEKKIPLNYFSPIDNTYNAKVLKAVREIANNKKEERIRVFSTRVFNDSKEFERNFKSPSVKIIRAAKGLKEYTDDEILSLFNLIRYPEIIEFRGKIVITLIDGTSIDFSSLKDGAYINSTTVKHIKRIDVNAKRVLSIENKANYYDEILKNSDDLVIFHGGFHSPAKERFLSLISASLPPEVEVFHFGDIDLGGFKIFNSIQEIFSSLKPLNMDKETLLNNKGRAIKIEGKYLLEVKEAIDDPKYSTFKEVLKVMRDEEIKLEQEAILI